MKCITSMISRKDRKCFKFNNDGSATLTIQLNKNDNAYSRKDNGQILFTFNSPSSWKTWNAREVAQIMRVWKRKWKCTYVEH